jgi:hypothetical protein
MTLSLEIRAQIAMPGRPVVAHLRQVFFKASHSI